jgi:hypothetical protein
MARCFCGLAAHLAAKMILVEVKDYHTNNDANPELAALYRTHFDIPLDVLCEETEHYHLKNDQSEHIEDGRIPL